MLHFHVFDELYRSGHYPSPKSGLGRVNFETLAVSECIQMGRKKINVNKRAVRERERRGPTEKVVVERNDPRQPTSVSVHIRLLLLKLAAEKKIHTFVVEFTDDLEPEARRKWKGER